MSPENALTARTVAVVAALCLLVAAGGFVGGVVAEDHTREEAPHYGPDEEGNATFEFLEREDHHPGAQDVDVRYTLKGGAVYEDVGATDGIAADRFANETDAVDHSDCTAENVATFGVDRGDDGDADEHDRDLLQHARQMYYFDDGVVVEFYDHEDFGGDPPVIHADDRVVLELSDESAGGGCADTTEEVGFYDAELFLNGTGPMESNGTDERYGFTVESEYTYVCECEDEEEAQEKIGPPPATPTPTETSSGTATATPTSTATESPRTPTPDGTPVLTATVNESAGGANVSANASAGEDGGSVDASVEASGGEDRAAADPQSPTPSDGPGFGAGVAAAALLGGATLVRRRRV